MLNWCNMTLKLDLWFAVETSFADKRNNINHKRRARQRNVFPSFKKILFPPRSSRKIAPIRSNKRILKPAAVMPSILQIRRMRTTNFLIKIVTSMQNGCHSDFNSTAPEAPGGFCLPNFFNSSTNRRCSTTLWLSRKSFNTQVFLTHIMWLVKKQWI